MTESIKQWIADQADKVSTCEKIDGEKFIDGKTRMPYRLGLEKGIEIAEGFPDWANDNRYVWDHDKRKYIAAWDNYSEFTTSQLLEKHLVYLKTLEK